MKFGDYRIEILPDTEFRLDGGAMFGVVPRTLWERVAPPDESNRIRMNMNCLFVETPTEKILVETGIGEKWSKKQTRLYGIFREKPFTQTLFEKTGCRPEEITIVVNTHLHFDHAGGNTISDCGLRIADCGFDEDRRSTAEISKPTPQFPNARYLVSKFEFENAENPTERDRASYLAENWRPLADRGQLELMPDEYEVVAGLTMETVRGHSASMQTVRLTRGGETLYGFADLVPTRAHVAPAWIMGYDLYPLETLAAKKRLLPRAVAEDWLCLFYHDFSAPLCRLTEKDGKILPVPV
ncbi:MAG: MBL fold metallo-hydrolase [Acidobacteria bacterium]|nr:MBL fold metallo-hydrolase [Acidobacteriota bacterium]